MDKAMEAVLALKDWNDNNIEQLKLVRDMPEDAKMVVQAERDSTEQHEIQPQDVKGFKMGVILAISMLEKFPVTITKNEK